MFKRQAMCLSLLAAISLSDPDRLRAQDGEWVPLSPPTSRNRHTAIYDPVRDRMLVFGGNNTGVAHRDLWMLSLAGTPAWSPLTPTIAPIPRRSSHTAVYDPVRDRMIVFGGADGSAFQDVWVVPLAGDPLWSQITPLGTPPAARSEHTATYDPIRDRMIVYGGSAGSTEVWVLSLSGTPAWSQLSPTGTPPAGRYGHSAVYDPGGDRLIIFGGRPPLAGAPLNDVWALSLAGTPAWIQLVAAGPPTARYGHSAIYDPGAQRMIVFAGAPSIAAGDTWALSLAGSPAWTHLAPANALTDQRSYHSAIYDPVRNRMLVFGRPESGVYNDVQALGLGGAPSWSQLVPGVFEPLGTDFFYKAVSDPVRGRMVAFGGDYPPPDALHGALYAFTPSAMPPLWSFLSGTNPPPDRRLGHSIIYSPPNDAIVIYGGLDDQAGAKLGDVWRASLASDPNTWQQLIITTPPALLRDNHSAIYDPVRHRMVVFGGRDATGVLRRDVWAIDPFAVSPVWQQLLSESASGGPTAREAHTAIYHPGLDQMVVFGGQDGVSLDPNVYFMKLSSPPAWVSASSVGADPLVTPRTFHSSVYDPVGDRMLVFGGGFYHNDVWSFDFPAGPSFGWHLLAPTGEPPSPRGFHTAVYDSASRSMLVFGGFSGEFNADVMALRLPNLVAVPTNGPTPSDGVAVRVSPNPARGEVFMEIDAGIHDRPVGIRILDLQGRLVWQEATDAGQFGRRVRWNGLKSDGTMASPGVYIVTVGGPHARPARFVLLR